MKRQAAMKEESCWPAACFSRAWGSGPVQQLRRRYLGAPGLHVRPRPRPALGATAGAVAAGGGRTDAGGAAGGGKEGGGGGGGGGRRGGGGGWVNRRGYGGGGAWVNR